MSILLFLILFFTPVLNAQDRTYDPVHAAELWESGDLQKLRRNGFREICAEDAPEKFPINVKTAYLLLTKEQQDIIRRYKQPTIPDCIQHLESQLQPKCSLWQKFSIPAMYEGYKSTSQIMMIHDLDILKRTFREIPENKIAAWLQWLFPSHLDGVVIANYCHFDPIGELPNDTSDVLLTHLFTILINGSSTSYLNYALEQFFGNVLLATRKDKKNIKDDFKDVFKQDLIEYDKLPHISFYHRRITSPNRKLYLERSKTVVEILTGALEHQRTCSDYPPNIVLDSLMAFLYVRWQDFSNFSKISVLAPVTQENVLAIRNMQTRNLTTYHGGVEVNNSGPFYDCAEATILNILRYVIYTGANSTVNWSKLDELFSQSPRKTELYDFFKEFQTPAALHSHEAHQRWAKILSNLNSPSSKAPVIYAKSDSRERIVPSTKQKYEIYGHGIVNLLNVFANLTQDPELLTPWPRNDISKMRMAFTKFKHIMLRLYGPETDFHEMFDADLTLKNLKIMRLYPSIEFTVDRRPLKLTIDPLHFDLMDSYDSAQPANNDDFPQNHRIEQIIQKASYAQQALVSSILYWGAYITDRLHNAPLSVGYWSESIKDTVSMTALIFSNQKYIQPWHMDLLRTITNNRFTFDLSIVIAATTLPTLSQNKSLRLILMAPLLYTGYILFNTIKDSTWIFDNRTFMHDYFFTPNAAEHLGASLITYGFMKTSSYLSSRALSDHLSFNTAWYATAISPALTLAASEALWLYQLVSIIKSAPKTMKIIMLLTFLPIIAQFNPYILQKFGQYFLFEVPARFLCQYTSIGEYTLFHDTHCW